MDATGQNKMDNYLESLDRSELIDEVLHLQELVKAHRDATIKFGRDGVRKPPERSES